MGDSYVYHAGKLETTQDDEKDILWTGVGGAGIGDIPDILTRTLQTHTDHPKNVVLHAGSNDLFNNAHVGETRHKVVETLKSVRSLLPEAKIIWSDILPKQTYEGEKIPGAGKKTTRNINRFAQKACLKMDVGCVIYHSRTIDRTDNSLFSDDGIYLTDKGYECLRQTLTDAISFFDSNPGATRFPLKVAGESMVADL